MVLIIVSRSYMYTYIVKKIIIYLIKLKPFMIIGSIRFPVLSVRVPVLSVRVPVLPVRVPVFSVRVSIISWKHLWNRLI